MPPEEQKPPQRRPLVIAGLGEALYDVFPNRAILGGAPLNVAVQAHQLVTPLGGYGLPVSRIGQDDLGRRMTEELSRRGIPTRGLQIDTDAPTGRVLVTLQEGQPSYQIVEEVAWDRLEFTPEWRAIAEGCGAVCFGSLAQRATASRTAIQKFLRHARQAIRLFDVNLRQEYFTADVLQAGCELAHIVKFNEHELPRIGPMLGISAEATDAPVDKQAETFRQHYELDAVVLTRGSEGTMLITAEGAITAPVPQFPREEGADSVGAGDACSAGVLLGYLQGWEPARTTALANTLGAYVASRSGATPTLPDEILRQIEG